MRSNIKVLAFAVVGFAPVVAFADPVSQDAVAVALGASFEPVTMVNTVSLDGLTGTVEIPALNVSGQTTGYWHGGIPVRGSTTPSQAGVTFENVPGTAQTTTMELTSISVAAAAGTHAVASAVSDSNGRTAANSGASIDSDARLSAETESTRGNSYASEVLVGSQYRR